MNNSPATYLLYLHGRAYTGDSHRDFVSALAVQKNAYLLTPYAPYPDGDGWSWFSKTTHAGKQFANESEMNRAIDGLMNLLNEQGISPKQVILCGHSQGGGLAITMGMRYPFKEVISICGDLPYNVAYPVGQAICSSMIWVEGLLDDFLNLRRKSSRTILDQAGVPYRYWLSPSTSHHQFGEPLLTELAALGSVRL